MPKTTPFFSQTISLSLSQTYSVATPSPSLLRSTPPAASATPSSAPSASSSTAASPEPDRRSPSSRSAVSPAAFPAVQISLRRVAGERRMGRRRAKSRLAVNLTGPIRRRRRLRRQLLRRQRPPQIHRARLRRSSPSPRYNSSAPPRPPPSNASASGAHGQRIRCPPDFLQQVLFQFLQLVLFQFLQLLLFQFLHLYSNLMETGAKIRVYGTKACKGDKVEITSSDGNEAKGTFEELYVQVSADTYDKVDAAVALIEMLVTPVSSILPRCEWVPHFPRTDQVPGLVYILESHLLWCSSNSFSSLQIIKGDSNTTLG
ncbi:hypothetical protein RHGRI_001772 [Rhododendron griersonianum]|uniref:Translation elongation factor KOW-like domain-containing protein n=1 Tax=Rhododendron griersonianum TaxID=479676 RepID=A0AAV6LPN1_9ERIC|nr:hypothetical protein RHGRI_001772 [Rhododendron griersonianum]